jgi:REP element-mobilizing transposase RayT
MADEKSLTHSVWNCKYHIVWIPKYRKKKRNYLGRRQNFTDQNFWARAYYVSTVGFNEEVIKKYIREQET